MYIFTHVGVVLLLLQSIHMAIVLYLYLAWQILVAAAQVPADLQTSSGRLPGGLKPNEVYCNIANTTQGSKFQQNVKTVISFLYDYIPASGYATCLGYGGNLTSVYSDEGAFAHSGCYNNTNQPKCRNCLKNAYTKIQNLVPLTLGATVWINETAYRCSIRYENYNFSDDLVSTGTLGVIGPNITAPLPSPPGPNITAPLPSPPGRTRGFSSKTRVIIGASVGGLCFVLGVIGIFLCFWFRKRFHTKLRGRDELEASIEGPVVFSYSDLSVATKGFSEENKLGQGGFGAVYKASFPNGMQVAVKRLSMQSQQGRKEFINEINIITSIQHRNLARLKGYCIEGDQRLLVYEFLENGSLDQALFACKDLFLDWKSRFPIVLGIARGLAYLHEESHIQIIHRDIKASNILLDRNMQPKISDFGISKLFGDNTVLTTSTKVAGTVGYLAPEYATRGRLTTKADVFSFGVLLLEILSGRKCIDSTLSPGQELLVLWTWSLYTSERLGELIDKRLDGNYSDEEVKRLIHVAMLCTQDLEEHRPLMSDVVSMIVGYLELGPIASSAPQYYGQVVIPLSNGRTSSSSQSAPITVLQPR